MYTNHWNVKNAIFYYCFLQQTLTHSIINKVPMQKAFRGVDLAADK
jgi:hypothetical protein